MTTYVHRNFLSIFFKLCINLIFINLILILTFTGSAFHSSGLGLCPRDRCDRGEGRCPRDRRRTSCCGRKWGNLFKRKLWLLRLKLNYFHRIGSKFKNTFKSRVQYNVYGWLIRLNNWHFFLRLLLRRSQPNVRTRPLLLSPNQKSKRTPLQLQLPLPPAPPLPRLSNSMQFHILSSGRLFHSSRYKFYH